MNSTNGQNSSSPIAPAVFKFEGQAYYFIALLAIDCLFLFLGFAIEEGRRIRQESFSFGDLFGFGLLFIFVLLQVPNLRRKSDIVVDDQGISRRFIGWTWQTIRWDNIRVIKTLPYSDPVLKKKVRLFSIYPSILPRFRLFPAGGMGFSDQLVNMGELIEILNHYVTKYKIRIEAADNDGMTSVTRL